MPENVTTPEDVANVLLLGVLEQIPKRVPVLTAHLARLGAGRAALADENHIRAEAVTASLAFALLTLRPRLSPDHHRAVHEGVTQYLERMVSGLSTYFAAYYAALRDATENESLQVLGCTFRTRSCGGHTGKLAPEPFEDLRLASRLVPKGLAPLAVGIGRLLRQTAVGPESEA